MGCRSQLLTGPVALAPQLVPCVGGLFSEVVGCLLCGVNCVFATAFALLLVSISWGWPAQPPPYLFFYLFIFILFFVKMYGPVWGSGGPIFRGQFG